MPAHGAHRFVARALVALAAGALALPALAAEDWPPRTPPRVPSDGQPPPASVAPPPTTTPPALPSPSPAAATPSPAAPTPAPVAPAPTSPPEVEAKPAPVVELAPPASSAAETVVRGAPAPLGTAEPLYGLSGNRLYARTARDEVVVFPGGLVQLDGHSFQTGNLAVPDTRLWLNRARPEITGWLGRAVYFNAAADFAHGPSLRGVDDYAAVAPWRDRAILQVGQFDAPFTFENQTRDRDLDFLERSIAVRAFAIPENKKRGAMLHGTTDDQRYYFAAGAFMGDGQKDLMGRAWVAPFSFRDPDVLRAITVGGSVWLGDATASAALAPQMTGGSVVVLEPSTRWLDGGTTTSIALGPRGRYEAAALELNAPLWHRAGVRFEWITKHTPLAESSAVNGGATATRGGFGLGGWAAYGEAWYWILGNDRLGGTPGLALPVRLTRPFGLLRPLTGVMVVARLEHLDENLSAPAGASAASEVWTVGSTTVTTARLGLNVWFASRARVTFDYAWNRVGGTTLYSTSFTDPNIQELSVRLALTL